MQHHSFHKEDTAADIGTIRRENQVASLEFSRAEQSARDAAGTAAFCGNNVPISG
jgi:hypothetical protein